MWWLLVVVGWGFVGGVGGGGEEGEVGEERARGGGVGSVWEIFFEGGSYLYSVFLFWFICF